MKKNQWTILAALALTTTLLISGCSNTAPQQTAATQTSAETAAQTAEGADAANESDAESASESASDTTPDNALVIAKQGMFSSGGTVTEPVEGEYDETQNWLDNTRAGNTAHVDHANVFYQIPANDNGNPIVYLHGYGQSRMG